MNKEQIRLFLVDDHSATRESLAELLDREQNMLVVGQVGTFAEARSLLTAGVGVDVVLVDLELPDGDGVDLIHDLRRQRPTALMIVLTASRDELDRARSVAAGAAAVLHKSTPIRGVVDAIRRLAAGEVLMSPRDVAELVRQAAAHRAAQEQARRALAALTLRERDILEALAEGLGDEAIAARLGVSPKTVRNQMVVLLDKLGVDSRLQALVVAVHYGAIRLTP